jgi:hypothetical protein
VAGVLSEADLQRIDGHLVEHRQEAQ